MSTTVAVVGRWLLKASLQSLPVKRPPPPRMKQLWPPRAQLRQERSLLTKPQPLLSQLLRRVQQQVAGRPQYNHVRCWTYVRLLKQPQRAPLPAVRRLSLPVTGARVLNRCSSVTCSAARRLSVGLRKSESLNTQKPCTDVIGKLPKSLLTLCLLTPVDWLGSVVCSG